MVTRETLEDELEVDSIRNNEGEAAQYGIYFDDTKYDYMQHLRSVGEAPDAVLLAAPASKSKGKAVAKEVVFSEKVPAFLLSMLIIAWYSKGSTCFRGGE